MDPPPTAPGPEAPAAAAYVAAAPPVVAVVVAADPGPWFEEALASLGAQDYPELSVLVIDAGREGDLTPRVAAVLPGAYVRRAPDGPGYAAAANEVLTTVEGSAFYVLCHDDVALADDAIRLLVEECLRSNAGVVGPKLVEWDHPERLLAVGLGVDKTGAVSPLLERGELDQEQHDAVRDVFAVPSACLLVRADLFASLGGFDPVLGQVGADVDLCWRAQVAGARVLVAPGARVRHVEARSAHERVARERLAARHRVRTMLTCYTPFHLVRVLPQALAVSLVETIVALAGARWADARAQATAWTANVRRLGEVRAARRAVQARRVLPDAEVRRLQTRGSAHLTAFLRGQLATETRGRALARAVSRVAEDLRTRRGRLLFAVWAAVVVVLVAGSRHLLTGRVATVGQLAPFPDHPGTLLHAFFGGWRTTGLGSQSPAPPAFALLGAAGVVFIGAMGALRKVLVLALLPVGAAGAARLVRPFESAWARAVAVVVYLAVPLPYDALARGRVGGLVAYAAVPWLVARLLAATGLEPFAPAASRRDVGAPAPTSRREAWRAEAVRLGLPLAVAAAFAPELVLVVVIVAVALVAGSALAGGAREAARAVAVAAGAVVVAAALLFPWTLDFVLPGREWATLGGVAPSPAHAPGIGALLRFQLGPLGAAPLGWALLVAAALPLVIGQDWRLAWATRLWAVVIVCAALAWASGRGWLPVRLQSPDALLAPAALAVAAAAALGMVAFEVDLPRYAFGWRQAVPLTALAALVLGVLPVVGAAFDGRWHQPDTDFARSLSWMPPANAGGAYRVLWIGDPRSLPLAGWRITDGLAYATSRNGTPDVTDLWPGSSSGATRLVPDLVGIALRGDTTRLGHLLAPMAIRYVVVPERVAPARTQVPLTPAPARLTAALDGQVDLRRLPPSDAALDVYESTAWGPLVATAPPAPPVADGAAALPGVDLSGAKPALRPTGSTLRYRGRVDGSSDVLLSEASSPRWHLSVGGRRATRTRSFGWANRFHVTSGGPAVLSFSTPLSRDGALLLEVLVWVAAFRAVRTGRRARRRAP